MTPTPPIGRNPEDRYAENRSVYRQILIDPRAVTVADLTGFARVAAVASRNVYWGRTHGWLNLLEEHDLNLVRRIPRDFQKWKWRARNGALPGTAAPVFLVGAQRSGTNMVTYGLSYSPEFKIYNEGDKRAFSNYRLRDLDAVSRLVNSSRHPFVLFKPLNDTHRIVELLEEVNTRARPKALWVYRDVGGRTKSALDKFGDSNLRVLRQWAKDGTFTHWQLGEARGLSAASIDTIRRNDPSKLTPADGSALFWLIRNRLFFEQGLDQRDDVLLVSYDTFTERPAATMKRICGFLGLSYDPSYVSHVQPRTAKIQDMGISDGLKAECLELSRKLDVVAQQERFPAE